MPTIKDYSYFAKDGALQAVSVSKSGDESPVLTVNGERHDLAWAIPAREPGTHHDVHDIWTSGTNKA
jgi:hypothetical protein